MFQTNQRQPKHGYHHLHHNIYYVIRTKMIEINVKTCFLFRSYILHIRIFSFISSTHITHTHTLTPANRTHSNEIYSLMHYNFQMWEFHFLHHSNHILEIFALLKMTQTQNQIKQKEKKEIKIYDDENDKNVS